ncbi:MAG: phosphonoacetaldehyde hydrolase [Planctomycetota bacterium]|nr:phosphonoacetaldehyde hydrolase [Planctomycetota bacterium]
MTTDSIVRGGTTPASAPRTIKALVLDWAGTTVDFGSCAPAATFVEAFAQHGVTITQADARAPMGMAKRDHIAAIARTPGATAQWSAKHGRPFGEGDIDAIYATFLPLQEACVERFSEVIPGALEMLAWMRSRSIRVGSATGYTRPIMDRVMAAATRQGFEVDCMLCATDIEHGRPHPWIVFENMRRLNVYPPAAVVVVDDTVVGVQSGVNAGAWAVGVVASGNLVGLDQKSFEHLPDAERTRRIADARRTLLDAGAHFVIDTVADLPEVVRRIEAMPRN